MTSCRKHKDLLGNKTELESKSFDMCFSEEKVRSCECDILRE